MWGGVECTVNRVGERYFDQIERTGHAHRLSDLDLIAGLGLRTVRYPVLWERAARGLSVEPEAADQYEWRWSDERLERLRELGIRPIVGLVHHGSGPQFTDLLDPEFPRKLARYARAVAERYPWVDAYTPVNEPLTTARFSALYGHWYPHRRDLAAFARALLNQVRGTVLAMREIRTVNTVAQLVQTDDLGRTTSTAPLQYQADFENERRWLGWDLLSGHVAPAGKAQPMYQHLQGAGVSASELAWFGENACPPDVIGVNHYVTSERFLDHRLERWPAETHGGNGRDRYADVETGRAGGIGGPAALLHECWDRFRLPIVITECHLWSTREEQLRWLTEVWRAAQLARTQGADVRAVTAWSLFGAYDWDSLLTRDDGRYETGAFDARLRPPFPTALARAIIELAQGRETTHPLLNVPGWWRQAPPPTPDERALVITGHSTELGDAFTRIAALRGIPHVVERHAHSAHRTPWAVLDLGSADERALQLAKDCAGQGSPLVSFSTERVLEVYPQALVLRTGAFGAEDVNDLVHTTLNLLVDGASGLVHLADHRLTR